MAKTGEGLARYAEWVYNIGSVYAWATYGQRLQERYAKLKASYYYTVKNPSGFLALTALYEAGENPNLHDCHGIKDGYMMSDDNFVLTPVPGVDTTADADFEYVMENGMPGWDWGGIDTLPADNRGLAVRHAGHFGVCIGGGMVIDIYWTGHSARKKHYSQVPWTHWFRPMGIDYGDGGWIMATLRKGATGTAVRDLQTKLNALGYPLEVDGSFGTLTHNAVVAFQTANGLVADGIVGEQTWTKLNALYAQKNSPPPVPPETDYKALYEAAAAVAAEKDQALLDANNALASAKEQVAVLQKERTEVLDAAADAAGAIRLFLAFGQKF